MKNTMAAFNKEKVREIFAKFWSNPDNVKKFRERMKEKAKKRKTDYITDEEVASVGLPNLKFE